MKVFKINIILICLAGFLFSSCNKRRPPPVKPKTDLEKAYLKGKVKLIRTLKRDRFDTNFSQITNIAYNIEGNELEHNDTTLRETELPYRILMRYNERGNKTEEAWYSGGRLMNKFVYSFDADGYRTEDKEYDSTGKEDEKMIYKYDDNGNLKERDFLGDSYTSKWYEEYDDNRNLLKETWYKKDSLVHTTIYKYDTKGNMLEDFNFDGNGTRLRSHSYGYDSAGNKIVDSVFYTEGQCVNFPHGNLNELITYKYDSYGNEIYKETWFYGNSPYSAIKLVHEHQYKYDTKCNWVENIDFANGRISTKEERQIEYYK